MQILAEVSDAVQIATLVTGLVATMFGGVIAYMTARLRANSEAAATAAAIEVEKVRQTAVVAANAVERVRMVAATAATAVAEVKTTLETQHASTDTKLEGIAEIGDAIHTLVNSQMGAQLRLSAETSRFKADTIRGDPNKSESEKEASEVAAQLAEQTLAEHQHKQRAVDAGMKVNA